MDDDERTRQFVHEAAGRLSELAAELARRSRTREFQRELRERGNWLSAGPAPAPPWVERWNRHFEGLKSDPAYLELQSEWQELHERLHGEELAAAIERLKLGDGGAAEWAIAYLEADPRYFRSGYLKGSLSRWLRQVPLSEPQRDRLRAAILSTLAKGGRLEFGETRRLARRLDSPRFREQIERLLDHRDPGTVERARLLLESCALNETRGDWGGAR